MKLFVKNIEAEVVRQRNPLRYYAIIGVRDRDDLPGKIVMFGDDRMTRERAEKDIPSITQVMKDAIKWWNLLTK